MAQAPDETPLNTLIDAAKRLNAATSPFAFAAVGLNGDDIVEYSIGSESKREQLSSRSILQVGSLSKVITSIALIRAARYFKIDIYADISEVVSSYCRSPKGAPITFSRLMGHTAGFSLLDRTSDLCRPNSLFGPYRDNSKPTATRDPYLARRVGPRATAAEFWSYANHHINLAVIAIEDLTRTPFDQLLALMLEDDDLQPIAIDDFATTPSHVVDGFSSRYPDRVIRPRRFNGVYSGGLGINLAQLPALARLIKVALEEPETSVMLECQRLADNSLIPFAGTGLRLKYYRGVQFGVHGGNFNGHAAYMVAIPSHKFVGILWGSRIGLRSLRTTLERVVRKVIDSTITTEDARPPLSMHAGFRIDRRQSGYSYALVARHVVGKGVNVDLERGEGYLSSPHGWFDKPVKLVTEPSPSKKLDGALTLLSYRRRGERFEIALTPRRDGGSNLWVQPMIQRFTSASPAASYVPEAVRTGLQR